LIASKRDAPSTSKIYRYKVVEIEKEREKVGYKDREMEMETKLALLNESAKVVFRAATK